MEEWKNIIGYEGIYQISNTQKIRNSKKGNLLGVSLSSGYYKVALSNRGIVRSIKIHRLLAIHFIPNPLNLPCVNHIDGNKLNNDLDNLEWCTYSENAKHAIRMGIFGSPVAKPKRVFQYSIEGNFIKAWESSMDIQREMGWKNGNISRCCIGNRPTAYGYIWKHEKTHISVS